MGVIRLKKVEVREYKAYEFLHPMPQRRPPPLQRVKLLIPLLDLRLVLLNDLHQHGSRAEIEREVFRVPEDLGLGVGLDFGCHFRLSCWMGGGGGVEQ